MRTLDRPADPAPARLPTGLQGPAFQVVRDQVLRAGGIDIDLYRDRCIHRRLLARVRAVGATDLGGYCRRLEADPQELPRLLDALTVNVSEFFRNRGTFRAIAREVLPETVARKRAEGRRSLRVWSAGCATGEEAYSLAITLAEHLGEALRDFRVAIFATDVDGPSLQAARLGRYHRGSVARMPRHLLRRYFEPSGEEYQVSQRTRRMVHFQHHNLLNPFPFRRIDLAVCRNVLIYMVRPLHPRLIDGFYDALNPGGFLVLGKVEGLAWPSRERFEVVNLAERIYRKPLAAPAELRAAAATAREAAT